MSKKAREYSSEEKAKVALEALKGELTMAQISSKYGIHATQINRWRKEALESMVSGFKSKLKIRRGGSVCLDNFLGQFEI